MNHKLTNIWPELVSFQPSQSSIVDGTDIDQDGNVNSSQNSVNQEVNEEELLEVYENLYWTRLIVVDEF